MYVDESKAPNYLLMGVLVESAVASIAREEVKGLLLPGQERVHFTAESAVRRRDILTKLRALEMQGIAANADGRHSEILSRSACLSALVRASSRQGVERIVLEQDDSSMDRDRRVLYRELSHLRAHGDVTYGWLRARQEPLLWAADAYSWAWSQGGSWRRRIRDVVELHEVMV